MRVSFGVRRRDQRLARRADSRWHAAASSPPPAASSIGSSRAAPAPRLQHVGVRLLAHRLEHGAGQRVAEVGIREDRAAGRMKSAAVSARAFFASSASSSVPVSPGRSRMPGRLRQQLLERRLAGSRARPVMNPPTGASNGTLRCSSVVVDGKRGKELGQRARRAAASPASSPSPCSRVGDAVAAGKHLVAGHDGDGRARAHAPPQLLLDEARHRGRRRRPLLRETMTARRARRQRASRMAAFSQMSRPGSCKRESMDRRSAITAGVMLWLGMIAASAASQESRRPPLPLEVNFSAPIEGEADVRLDAIVRIQFSRDVDARSFEKQDPHRPTPPKNRRSAAKRSRRQSRSSSPMTRETMPSTSSRPARSNASAGERRAPRRDRRHRRVGAETMEAAVC